MQHVKTICFLPPVLGTAVVVLLGFPQAASGHGCLVSPPSWFDTHGLGSVKSVFALIDTNKDGSLSETEYKAGLKIARMAYARDELTPQWGLCTHGYYLSHGPMFENVHGLTSSPFWFAHGTRIPGVPKLKGEFRTYADKLRMKNPWMAPGSANLDGLGKSPCGWLRHEDGSSYVGSADARHLAPFPETQTTVWAKGSAVEVKWAISANHGGGYAYRLCKKPADGDMMKLTEACFQQGHLDFVGDKSWVEYSDGFREEIQAKRTNQGTTPEGKTWTRNPIPAWKCATGSPHSGNFAGIAGDPKDCKDFNFHPPNSSLAGYGYSTNGEEVSFKWALVDKVQLPTNLKGDYVLSWRWDSEQTPQVWAHCADVKIVDSVTTTTTKKPSRHEFFEWEAHLNSVCRLDKNDQSHNGGGTIDHKGHLLDVFSLDACKFACQEEMNCKGIEFHLTGAGKHCEIWTEDIGHILPRPGSGYHCQRLITRPDDQDFVFNKAEIKGQPAVAEVPRRTWAIMHMSIVTGIAAAAVLALAVVVVRRMTRLTASQNERWSDNEAEGTLLS